MRKVWLPIVGPGYEIIVLHIHKSRGTSNLGISIEGVTYVAEPDFDHENLSSTTVTTNSQIEDKSNSSSKLLPNGMAKSAHSNDIKYSDMPSRHFVQYIVPDGLVGSLGVVQKGDELLQANGHRIHGTTHTSTLRYLRNLPSRIELVFARRKSTYENGGDDVFSITGGKDQLIDVAGESLLEVAASEIGSVDTGSSMRIVNAYDNVDRSIYSSPVSPATAHKRVTEWIRKSQGDLSATIDYSSSPESSVTKQTNNKSERFNYCDLKHPLNNYVNPNYTSKLQQQYPVNTMKNNRKYSLPSTMQRSETQIHSRTLGRLPISRSGKVCMEKQSTEQHDHRRCQTLPHYHHNRPNRIDPRYGFKRPCWSSVPLIIQLNKTTHGFGFSIAEYEELPVTDLEGNTLRKAYSLDRRSSNIIGSDRRSFHSYHSTGSTIASLSSLPGKNSKSSSRLKRRSTWSSRSKSHGILLVDSLTPGGIAQLDGRISIGDRLLFVNDKNLMKSSVSEAATTLKSLPNGPCLIGIAKMQLESNETDDIHEKSQQQLLLPYPVVSSRPSVIGMFPDTGEMKKISVKSDLAYPLHVNTGDSTIDNDDNNTIMSRHGMTACFDNFSWSLMRTVYSCPSLQRPLPDSVFTLRASITDNDNNYDKYRMPSINKRLFTGNSLDQLQQQSESFCGPRSPTPNHLNPLLLETNLSSTHQKCKSYSYIEQLGKYTNQYYFHRHHSYRMCTLSECGQSHMIHDIQKCLNTNIINQLPLHLAHEIVQKAVDLINCEVLDDSMRSNSTTERNRFISSTSSTKAGTTDSSQSWTQSMISGFLTSSNVNVDDSNNSRLGADKVDQILTDHHSASSLISRSSYCTTDNNASSTQYLADQLVIQSILKALKYLEEQNTSNDRLCNSSVTSSTIPHHISTPTKASTIELISKSREFSVFNRHQLPYISQSGDVNNGSEWCSASSKLSSYYRFQFLSDENGHNNVDNLYSNGEMDNSNNNNAIIIGNDKTDDNDEEEDVKTECDLSTSSSVSLSPYVHPKTMSSSIESDHHEFNHLRFESLFIHNCYSSPKSIRSNEHANSCNSSISYNNSKTVDKHNSGYCCVIEHDHDASQSRFAGERLNISSTSHQYSCHRHRSGSHDNHAILDNQLTNRIDEKHEKLDIKNGLNATGTEDLALDFYTLPLLCPNPQLHAPDLQYVTPVDPTLEISERLERGSLPIGLKLDALACHGQDGCRVVQVLGGGAVARDQVLVTNDYITSLNGLSMRYLDNLKAFEILHSLSQNSAVIHITYFPASVIESHRIKCLSKTLNQTSENPLQRSSFPYSSIVQPINWSPPVAIVLHRLDTSQPWGLVVSGSDICSKLNCSAPMNLENPSIVSEILPNSVGKNCKLLSRGLLILQIQDIDVSTKGPNYVNAYLQYLSDQPGLREIHIVVCHFNDDCTKHIINGGVAEMFNPGNQVNITNYTTSTTTTTNNNFTDKMELSNYLNISTPINGQLICDHIVHPGTSPSSSDMEDPEPLTDMESRDVVDILSRSVPSPDPNNSSDSQHNTYRKTTLCPLSQLSSPILKDEDNAVNTDVIFSTYEKSDKKSILQNGWVSDSVCSSSSPSFPPPPLPSRRLSTTSKEQEATGYLKPMVVNDSNVNELNFYSPVKLYTRDSQDEILVIRLPLLINSSSNYTHNVNEETENLGFHLVSCSNPESMATFVASCQTDSSGGLECGDEIIQVEDINVCGLDHISVQHIIHSKITELMLNKYSINNSSNNYFIGNDNNGKVSDSDQSVIKSFITLIIRRNPKNLSLMSFSRECNDSPLSVDNLTGSTCSKALSSSSPNPLPTGSKPIPHTFLKEIMVELNEDFWKFQLFDIILERGSDGFGIFIVNLSPNNEPGVFVSEIRPNSPAQLQGVLRPHDRILAIDGQLQCDYESTLELLQKSRKSVRLTIGRQIPCHSDSQQMLQFGYVTTTGDNPDNDTKHHKLSIIPGIPATVTLYKTDGGLGFSIVGGSDTVLSNILVHEVHSGGAAARDGRLQVGDRLLAVNGIDLREATQKDATKIIRTADDCIQLVVYRDPEPQYINQGVFECHNVHLKRDMPGQSFGLSLIGRPHYSTGTAIGGIIENSPAARSNLLEVGDIILEINGWDMRLAKSDEVVNLLKNAHSDVKLLIGRYKTGPSMHGR
ncbi:unnamed protein product [Schistosoma margrebowiei]|nr:unnamed protein product [Schistosoma margrebowiei]